jgi:hypothetical protein
MTTSLGKVQLDSDGHAEVDDEMFDLLISIPENAEYQAKLDAQNSGKIVPTLEEYIKAGYHAENYERRFCGFKAGDTLDEEAIRKNQDEQDRQQNDKKDELKEEDLQLLELPDLKAIAKQRKIQFVKTVTKPELIASIMATPPQPPPPPPELP